MSAATDMRGPAAWQADPVRYREFWQLVDEVFGPAYGRALARDQVLGGARRPHRGARPSRTASSPATVWHALCDAMDVPEDRRWGLDARRPAPPRA